jgi:hypothetical protein
MNRTFNPISRIQRSVLATAAVLATVITFGSIAVLVEHYTGGLALAHAQPAVVAQR